MTNKYVTFALAVVVLAVAMATVDAKKPEDKQKGNKMPCSQLMEFYASKCIGKESPIQVCSKIERLINTKECGVTTTVAPTTIELLPV